MEPSIFILILVVVIISAISIWYGLLMWMNEFKGQRRRNQIKQIQARNAHIRAFRYIDQNHEQFKKEKAARTGSSMFWDDDEGSSVWD